MDNGLAVGPFVELAQLIDPPHDCLPTIQIKGRGNPPDEFHAWQIKFFIDKKVAEGLTKNKAKELAMAEFGLEKTAVEDAYYYLPKVVENALRSQRKASKPTSSRKPAGRRA